jgi:hypothetical protein
MWVILSLLFQFDIPNVQDNRTRPAVKPIKATNLKGSMKLSNEPKAGFRLIAMLGLDE